MPVTLLGTGQTPYNINSTPYLPAGVDRYFVVSICGFTASGQGLPAFATFTFKYNNVNIPIITFTYRGTYGDDGYAQVWGMSIPNSWAAGSYAMVGISGYQRNAPYAFFGNVHPTNPIYASFTPHHATAANIGAVAKSMDPVGGGYFIVIGVDYSGSDYLVSNNVTNITGSGNNNKFGGATTKVGGTQNTTFSSGPTTSGGAGLIGTFRATPIGSGASVIWWFRKWIEEKKRKILQPFPVGI